MNFDFSDEQKLLQKTARDYLADRAPLALCREILESDDKRYAEDLWAGIAEMGWLGAAIPESYGGAGFGALELALIAEEIGRSLAPVPFGSSVYLATEAIKMFGSEDQKVRYLADLAAGRRIGTWAIAERPGLASPGTLETALEGEKLRGRKVPVLDGDVADFAIVAARSDGGVSLAIVDLSQSGVARSTVPSIDPSRSQAELVFDDATAEPLGERGRGWELAERVRDRAAVWMAFEQIGGADRAFEMTRDFAMGRYAFGRPIASFQALKHRMADLYCALELARSNAYYGAWALHDESPELATAACGARVSATEAFDLAATEMIQIYGGVGFTWEYDCQLFYRRAKLTGLALGGASLWRELLIARLDAAGSA